MRGARCPPRTRPPAAASTLSPLGRWTRGLAGASRPPGGAPSTVAQPVGQPWVRRKLLANIRSRDQQPRAQLQDLAPVRGRGLSRPPQGPASTAQSSPRAPIAGGSAPVPTWGATPLAGPRTWPLAKPSKPSLTASTRCPSAMPMRTAERTAAFMPAAGAPTLVTATLKPLCKGEEVVTGVQQGAATCRQHGRGHPYLPDLGVGQLHGEPLVDVEVVLEAPVGEGGVWGSGWSGEWREGSSPDPCGSCPRPPAPAGTAAPRVHLSSVQTHFPRNLTASWNLLPSMAFCTSWVCGPWVCQRVQGGAQTPPTHSSLSAGRPPAHSSWWDGWEGQAQHLQAPSRARGAV